MTLNYGLVELIYFFGVALAWSLWELWSLKREQNRRAQKDE